MALESTELFPEIPNLYEFPSVHSDMIFDEHRVRAYQRAIERTVKPGDVIVDLGTGTGLLAFLCLRAGAARVHAIDRSAIIDSAKQLAVANGLADRITFHHCDSREAALGERVDVVIAELIGHMAFEEGIVEALIDAKRRFLRPSGTLLPESVKLRVALVSEQRVYEERIGCWRLVHGIDYSPLRYPAAKGCYLTALSDRNLLSEPVTFFSVDFREEQEQALCRSLTLEVCRRGELNGIAMWFDARLAPGVSLSSDPWTRTHWQQCFAPIAAPISVCARDRLSVRITMRFCSGSNDTFQFAVEVVKEE